MGDVTDLLYIALAFLLGGVLKGATGAGAPILAIPVLSLYHDVPTAVTVFVVPNILSNVWQSWQYRRERLPAAFSVPLVVAGIVGAGVGTLLLSTLSGQALAALVAAVLFVYIAFRLARPDWRLAYARAVPLAAPLGLVAGILQGASGISAPVSITFLNAMRLERAVFIATISIFFLGMGLAQLPLMMAFGLMTGERFLASGVALLPLLAGMPLGAWLARRVSRSVFDRVILALLGVMAVRLAIEAVR